MRAVPESLDAWFRNASEKKNFYNIIRFKRNGVYIADKENVLLPYASVNLATHDMKSSKTIISCFPAYLDRRLDAAFLLMLKSECHMKYECTYMINDRLTHAILFQ